MQKQLVQCTHGQNAAAPHSESAMGVKLEAGSVSRQRKQAA